METVGVGQTELGIVSVADTVIVTLMPESGDAIQALKAGVMEIADIFLVNKADREGAGQIAAAITATLQLGTDHPAWTPPVLLTAAQSGQGIDELWSKIQEHREFLTATSELAKRRGLRRQAEFLETVEEEMARRLKALVHRDPLLIATLEDVANKNSEPYSAAMRFIDSAGSKPDWLASLLSEPD